KQLSTEIELLSEEGEKLNLALDDLLTLIPIFVFVIVPTGMFYLIFKGIRFLDRAFRRKRSSYEK
ncbi:MAG: hypothetical protein ACHQ1H_13355, partial [Nitrososphaerales archaeon]